MTVLLLTQLFFILLCCCYAADFVPNATGNTSAAVTSSFNASEISTESLFGTTSGLVNFTHPKSNSPIGILHGIFGIGQENFELYVKAFYVVVSLAGVVAVYLGVKMFLIRRRKIKTRRYGILTDRQLELHQSGGQSNDEDDELFDQSRKRLIS